MNIFTVTHSVTWCTSWTWWSLRSLHQKNTIWNIHSANKEKTVCKLWPSPLELRPAPQVRASLCLPEKNTQWFYIIMEWSDLVLFILPTDLVTFVSWETWQAIKTSIPLTKASEYFRCLCDKWKYYMCTFTLLPLLQVLLLLLWFRLNLLDPR